MSSKTFLIFLVALCNQLYLATAQGISDLCTQPKKVGPCRARLPRYFFNRNTQQCELFYYGGCKSNANNFESVEDCERRCFPESCSLPQKIGPCEAVAPSFFFNSTSNRCESFNYGGCEGNANRFLTENACAKMCECSQQKDVGPCDGAFRRFFYNPKNGKCRSFIFGGCEENANNFRKRRECRRTCEDPRD